MKRFLLVVVLLGLLLSGCNSVLMSPEYSRLLDDTVTIADATAARAEAGQMSSAAMVDALRVSANVWEQFQQARDGKADK